jgi:hypothetical protein
MPNNPDQPFDYDTMKLRAVFVPDDAKDQVSGADIVDSLGYDSVKIPAVIVPEGGTPPGFPYERFGRTEFRPDEDSAATHKFTSGPSSSQPSDTEDVPAATLPRTRYRFGAVLAGGRSPAPPHPALAAGQGDPVAGGTAVWRGMKTPGAVWRQSPAAPSTMRSRATAAASGTENALTAPDGGAGVGDELGPFPPGQAVGSNVNADASNDPQNATDPAGPFADAGSGVTARLQRKDGTAGLQGKGGSGSIVQAQYAPAGALPAPLPPVVLPGTPESNDFVDSTIQAGKAIVNAIGNILNAERPDKSASQTPPAGDLMQTSTGDLLAAAKADGYSSIEEWKPQELQLDSRSNIVKDAAGNLYSVPRRGEGDPQPLDIELPQ